jgi:hypothetical protein
VNDTVTARGGKSFIVLNEPSMNVVNFGAEFGYNIEEKLSWLTSITFNQYSKLTTNAKAWGLIPLN